MEDCGPLLKDLNLDFSEGLLFGGPTLKQVQHYVGIHSLLYLPHQNDAITLEPVMFIPRKPTAERGYWDPCSSSSLRRFAPAGHVDGGAKKFQSVHAAIQGSGFRVYGLRLSVNIYIYIYVFLWAWKYV